MGKTLELAKRQGLVKSRVITNCLNQQKTSLKFNQKFTHFMVIDFESTCWEKRPGPPQEIIEFPAVILDVRSGEICSNVFHHYVQPTEEPYLSDFCINLTGIKQDQVENAAPLGSTLLLFNSWLRKNYGNFEFNTSKGNNF